MIRRILISTTVLIYFSSLCLASDLEHSVSGSEVEDVLKDAKTEGNSAFLINEEDSDAVLKSKASGVDYHFSAQPEVPLKLSPKKEYSESGYTLPGTFENQNSYVELDKSKMAQGFRNFSEGSVTLTFIKNDFLYSSANNVIDRTITTGTKSVKGGSLHFRHDDYLSRAAYLNTYWSVGAGVGFNSGKGFFVDGSRSDAVFKLWEIPLDLGIGLEIPFSSWFKLAGTGGPSAMGLVQNRSDYQRGEEGKRKVQYSAGYFVNGQIKLNMSALSTQTAYELFTESQITNLYMNIEARHQSYTNFQDPIEVTGTSFGIGFTFEYL